MSSFTSLFILWALIQFSQKGVLFFFPEKVCWQKWRRWVKIFNFNQIFFSSQPQEKYLYFRNWMSPLKCALNIVLLTATDVCVGSGWKVLHEKRSKATYHCYLNVTCCCCSHKDLHKFASQTKTHITSGSFSRHKQSHTIHSCMWMMVVCHYGNLCCTLDGKKQPYYKSDHCW